MWSVEGIWGLIRQRTPWAAGSTSKDDLYEKNEVLGLWKPSQLVLNERPHHGILSGVSSAFWNPFHGSHRDVQNTFKRKSDVPIEEVQENIDNLGRNYRRIMRARDEMLELRTQELIEWKRCAEMRGFFLESQQRFMDQAEALLSTQDSVEQMSRLRQHYRQARADLNAMEVQAGITRNLEERSSSVYFKLQEIDGLFVESCKSLVRMCPLPDLAKRESTSRIPSSSSEVSGASHTRSLHPTLEAYYDQAGNVGLIGEELANLDVEYEEERAARMMLADRNEEPSIGDGQFEHNYRTARSQIEQRLGVALHEVQLLRQRCIDEGFELDGRNKAQSEGTDDLLLDRGSDILDSADQLIHRASYGESTSWRMIEPDLFSHRGPVIRDPDEPFDDDDDDDVEIHGPGSPRAPDPTQNAHVLRWASQVPVEVDSLGPDSDVPDLMLEAQSGEEANPTAVRSSLALSPQAPSTEFSTTQWLGQALQRELANMAIFSKRGWPAIKEVHLHQQSRIASRLNQKREPISEAWSWISTPGGRSSSSYLQRRRSFDLNGLTGEAQPSSRPYSDGWSLISTPRRRSTFSHLQRRRSFDIEAGEGKQANSPRRPPSQSWPSAS